MKFKYNEATASLEIKDGLKSHFLIVRLLLIVTFVNVILNLSNSQVEFGLMKLIWLLIGMAVAVGLRQYFIKKTGSNIIPLEQIVSVQDKSTSVRKKYALILKNGKRRDLIELQSEAEYKELQTLLAKKKK
ncbi:hypothetical protein [Flavobacterium turcicum]|uniref:Uncharacterized protein n=1 Tax=Flavobacterium turcicum TaxID=2764718 RepID=A0ABR7JC43_9FLAO|nr:hypothetical protein [Flavobacterium turcicum]MBC5862065.1 hypothetical protein [Flavobacterium turcicum]NHL00796.1 hypothetical protein [Flavobacterium turcicum]